MRKTGAIRFDRWVADITVKTGKNLQKTDVHKMAIIDIL